ncbi:MAG TPA: hypothetical protein VJ907_04680 [Halanaerobiales bacterium]|nr:hypothetical protein [Halanaerobiales bacterium]
MQNWLGTDYYLKVLSQGSKGIKMTKKEKIEMVKEMLENTQDSVQRLKVLADFNQSIIDKIDDEQAIKAREQAIKQNENQREEYQKMISFFKEKIKELQNESK